MLGYVVVIAVALQFFFLSSFATALSCHKLFNSELKISPHQVMLVREGGSININQQRILDFSQSAVTETPTVHWVGLGFKPDFVNHDNLPFPNRLFDVSLENTRTDKPTVSIADAYSMVTNDALIHARQFTRDFVINFPSSPISGLLTWLHKFGINDLALLFDDDLIRLQELTLLRHQSMGNAEGLP